MKFSVEDKRRRFWNPIHSPGACFLSKAIHLDIYYFASPVWDFIFSLCFIFRLLMHVGCPGLKQKSVTCPFSCLLWWLSLIRRILTGATVTVQDQWLLIRDEIAFRVYSCTSSFCLRETLQKYLLFCRKKPSSVILCFLILAHFALHIIWDCLHIHKIARSQLKMIF